MTNGGQWRLYCKRDRASSFFEFDLQRVLQDDTPLARLEFQLFYSLFRRVSLERLPDGATRLDAMRDGAQQFRVEIERRLRVQVFDCVEILARGFLAHDGNQLTSADLTEIYQNCLILLYRILFVLNAEARELLPTRPIDQASRTYFQSYGLEYVRHKVMDDSEYDDDGTFQLYSRLEGLFTLINGHRPPALVVLIKTKNSIFPGTTAACSIPMRIHS